MKELLDKNGDLKKKVKLELELEFRAFNKSSTANRNKVS